MDAIGEDLVEATWMEVGALSGAQARTNMGRIGKSQPYLLAFVLGTTEHLRPEVQELGIYLFFVIHRMFEKAGNRQLKRVTSKRIDEMYGQIQESVGRLEGAHARFLERAALSMSSSQPFVMKYLVEALMEAPEGDDPVDLSDEEMGTLFLVLKTVIDILDETTSG